MASSRSSVNDGSYGALTFLTANPHRPREPGAKLDIRSDAMFSRVSFSITWRILAPAVLAAMLARPARTRAATIARGGGDTGATAAT
jgi:hypothetical protein